MKENSNCWFSSLLIARVYSLREPQTPTKVIILSEAEEESLILNKR
jgi:hypothetical protein